MADNIWIPVFNRLGTWYRPILYTLISVIHINVVTHYELDKMGDQIQVAYAPPTDDRYDFIVGQFRFFSYLLNLYIVSITFASG